MLKKIKSHNFTYHHDKKILKSPPNTEPRQIPLNKHSVVCTKCVKDLWFQMVFQYRLEINSELPYYVKDRHVCYWGINCRTMDHNQDHAKRYNHMVYQTKFK
jgi:hypothetical protein